MKSDKSKIVTGYGPFEYIGEVKRVKNNRKNSFGDQKTPKTAFKVDFRLPITQKLRDLE